MKKPGWLVLLASSKTAGLPRQNNNSQPPSSEITLKIPYSIDVIEAVTEDLSPSSFRSSDSHYY
jgi:hypothetical protein